FGADATRLFVLFAAPVENELRWLETGIEGAVRFLRRVYTMVWRWHERLSNLGSQTVVSASGSEEPGTGARALRRKTHQTIARVTADFEDLHLNTIVAALM
ncbi:MAG: leucine--tRNA ligase, partial [Pyrinomonadaceae bacterium]